MRPGGESRWLLGAGTARRSESGAFLWSILSAIDVSERKLAEGSLERSNRLYRLLADHTQDVVMLLNRDGEAIYASPSAERFNGAKSFAGGLLSAVHPEDRPAAERAFAGALAGSASTAEWRYRRPTGETVWAETALTPVADSAGRVGRVVASGRDVSARKRLEDELRQADKLQAVGRLAAGVAHDFNNLLTVVNGCADLLAESLPPASAERSLAEDIAQAGARGATLTRQLLAFSRQQVMVVETFDPNALVRNCSGLLRRLLGDDIELVLELGARAGQVRADRTQLEQVVWNLAVNARDAMPEGGTLGVTTSEVEFAEGSLPAPEARPGRYVRLAVSDTGRGMPPEVLAHLFEPFFTTKPVGQGTGLGLATVYGIVRQSQGFLTVTSEVGAGTTVAAHLPAYQQPPEPRAAESRTPSRARGSEVVLVVEDDDAVRALTTTVLRRHGYEVVAAESGPAALEALAALPTPPDLLLTDVVMPRMGGRELAERLTALHPALKVGFLSGYTADAVLRDGAERAAFLRKPFTPDRLARFVRGILDQADTD